MTSMGQIVSSVGHLCIDLGHVELSGHDQQGLLRTVQAAVVTYLADLAASHKVITISLSQNNGNQPTQESPAPTPLQH